MSNCYIKLHPWDVFLKARMGAILFFQKQEKTLEEIATILSMDTEQLSAIVKSNPEGGDFFYAPCVEKDE